MRGRLVSKKKIMIVEDELLIAADIKNTLESWGYEVPLILSSAEEAVHKCSKMSFDLIVMDIKVKGDLDGVEAANQINQKYKIPILYLSAFSERGTLNNVRLNSLFGYLRKPFINNDLHSAVRWLTSKRESRSTPKSSREQQMAFNLVST